MKNLNLISAFALFLSLSPRAFAVSECGGRMSDGTFVLVHVDTNGPMGVTTGGEVSFEKGDNKFGYRFGHDEMPQYFEFDDQSNGSATVGLAAYVQNESPVSIRYVGNNFVDMDLKAVVDGAKVHGVKGNSVRVWKGPGHASTDQFQLTEVACAVWSNI